MVTLLTDSIITLNSPVNPPLRRFIGNKTAIATYKPGVKNGGSPILKDDPDLLDKKNPFSTGILIIFN
jgi:hypothetical protein